MVQETKQIIKMIETRRTKFIGHIRQYNKFIVNMDGKMAKEEDDREIQIWETQRRNCLYQVMRQWKNEQEKEKNGFSDKVKPLKK